MEEDRSGEEFDRGRDKLEELRQGLEVLERILLQEILSQRSGRGEVDDVFLERLSGYLKVVDRLIDIIRQREKSIGLMGAPGVRLVFEVLQEIPRVRMVLSEPEVRKAILEKIQVRLKQGTWDKP